MGCVAGALLLSQRVAPVGSLAIARATRGHVTPGLWQPDAPPGIRYRQPRAGQGSRGRTAAGGLGDALRIVWRMREDEALYELACVRWLGRFCLEAPEATLEDCNPRPAASPPSRWAFQGRWSASGICYRTAACAGFRSGSLAPASPRPARSAGPARFLAEPRRGLAVEGEHHTSVPGVEDVRSCELADPLTQAERVVERVPGRERNLGRRMDPPCPAAPGFEGRPGHGAIGSSASSETPRSLSASSLLRYALA